MGSNGDLCERAGGGQEELERGLGGQRETVRTLRTQPPGFRAGAPPALGCRPTMELSPAAARPVQPSRSGWRGLWVSRAREGAGGQPRLTRLEGPGLPGSLRNLAGAFARGSALGGAGKANSTPSRPRACWATAARARVRNACG